LSPLHTRGSTAPKAEILGLSPLSSFTTFLLVWSALAVRLFRLDSELLRWAVIVFLVLLLASGGSLLVRSVSPERIAVVVPSEVEVRTGPGADALVRFKLHAGSEGAVREQREGWARIELPDGKQGWLELEHVELVEL